MNITSLQNINIGHNFPFCVSHLCVFDKPITKFGQNHHKKTFKFTYIPLIIKHTSLTT